MVRDQNIARHFGANNGFLISNTFSTVTTAESERLVELLPMNSQFFSSLSHLLACDLIYRDSCWVPSLFSNSRDSLNLFGCVLYPRLPASVSVTILFPLPTQFIPQNSLCNGATGTKPSVAGIGVAATLFYPILYVALYCFLMYSLLQQITDSPRAIHTCYPNLFS